MLYTYFNSKRTHTRAQLAGIQGPQMVQESVYMILPSMSYSIGYLLVNV